MSWLSRIFRETLSHRQQPEAKFALSFDGLEIALRDPKGIVRSLKMADLDAIIIETNDTGPWGADVWWVLLDRDGKLGLLYPQGADGEQLVLDRLISLPGFNMPEFIKAMGSTANATFPVWKKPKGPAPV